MRCFLRLLSRALREQRSNEISVGTMICGWDHVDGPSGTIACLRNPSINSFNSQCTSSMFMNISLVMIDFGCVFIWFL